MCEYIERYEKLAFFLAECGFVVCGHDHLGHGRTGEVSGEWGFFGEHDGDVNLVEDINTLCNLMQTKYSRLPYFLLGHSLGSFAARRFAVLHPDRLSGLILSGTNGGEPLIEIGIDFVEYIIERKGPKYRSRYITNLAFGAYNAAIVMPTSKYAWVSRDTRASSQFEDDPWCSFIFTAAAYRDLFVLLDKVSHDDWYEDMPDIPVYLFSGDMDPVGGYGRGVRKVYEGLKARLSDVEMKLYEDARHETLNELNRQEVWNDLRLWLELHVKQVYDKLPY